MFFKAHNDEFDLVISLGSNCIPKYQISRELAYRFGATEQVVEASKNGETTNISYDFGAFFFDSLITDFNSLISVLESNFSDQFNIENLEIEEIYGWPSIKDNKSGIKYMHVLPCEERLSLNNEKLHRLYNDINSKVTYLANKTKNAINSDKNILFIYYGYPSFSTICQLLNVLSTKCKNFHVLYFALWNFGEPRPLSFVRSYLEYYKYICVLIRQKLFGRTILDIDRLTFFPAPSQEYPGVDRVWIKALAKFNIKKPIH